MTARPVLFVLAGVNGAGKSSVGGHLLTRAGLHWFNPDAFARELVERTGCDPGEADAHAWAEGVRRLDEAVAGGRSHAFETTLGGNSITRRLLAAGDSHDVEMWFCGLATPELHVERVRERVRAGGHHIPEARIRERWRRAPRNLVTLMPHLACLRVHDNSASAAPGEPVPDPRLVLAMDGGRVSWPAPDDVEALAATPPWARPLVEAALAPA